MYVYVLTITNDTLEMITVISLAVALLMIIITFSVHVVLVLLHLQYRLCTVYSFDVFERIIIICI